MTGLRSVHGAAAGALLLVLAGCGLAAAPSGSSSPALATVNGQSITTQDWKNAMNGLSVLGGQTLAATKANEATQVQQLVVWKVLQEWALNHKYTTNASATKSATKLIGQFQAQAGGAKKFKSVLKTYHLTMSTFEQFLAGQELLQAAFTHAVKNVPPPTAASIKAYYKTNKAQYLTPTQDELRMIVVKTDAEALKLENELKGGASFAVLAKKYSTDKVTAANGGQVGEVPQSTSTGAPSALITVMEKLKTGQYGIADVSGSYYLIQVEKITPASYASLKSVTSTIKTTLTQQTDNTVFQDFGQSLEAKAHVKLHLSS